MVSHGSFPSEWPASDLGGMGRSARLRIGWHVVLKPNPTAVLPDASERNDVLQLRGLRATASGELGYTDGVMLSRWREDGDSAMEISRAEGA